MSYGAGRGMGRGFNPNPNAFGTDPGMYNAPQPEVMGPTLLLKLETKLDTYVLL
jgi:hypothetical protein